MRIQRVMIVLLNSLSEVLSSLPSNGVAGRLVVLKSLVLLLILRVKLGHSLELVEVGALYAHVFLKVQLLLKLHHVLVSSSEPGELLVGHVSHSWLKSKLLALSHILKVLGLAAHEALHVGVLLSLVLRERNTSNLGGLLLRLSLVLEHLRHVLHAHSLSTHLLLKHAHVHHLLEL